MVLPLNESDNYTDMLEESLRKILELPLSKLKDAKSIAAEALGEDEEDEIDIMYEDIEELDLEEAEFTYDDEDI